MNLIIVYVLCVVLDFEVYLCMCFLNCMMCWIVLIEVGECYL